jgi:DNA-directed RNA polymerase subunit K/omega
VLFEAPEAPAMVKRPDVIGAFTFVVLARQRALQLALGCTPRLAGLHTVAVMAQMEVAAGEVRASDDAHEDVSAS